MTAYAAPLGRLLLSLIFILGGASKFANLTATGGYMETVGLPGILAGPAAAFELVAGLAILLGWQTRLVALLLAGFCLVTAALFHSHFADQLQMAMFLKNLGLAGGFLTLYVHGAGGMSLDSRKAG